MTQRSNQSHLWFKIGMALIFIFSVALRFWGLGRFNTLVFDEVYYAKFGNDYLTHTQFFNAHPPLSQYIIAIGIWIGSHIPWWQDSLNGLSGSLRSPLSYRWVNALTGSFIPLVAAAVAYQISYRRSFALLAGLFTAVDGIFLVESRYALNNIYIVIFGLLAQLCVLLALANPKQQRKWLILAGIVFGASAGTKWNGLFFLFGIYLMWIIAWAMHYLQKSSTDNAQTPLQNLTKLKVFHIAFYLGIIPGLTYSLIWIPHLILNPKYGFIEVHKQILAFHERLGGNVPSVHPYCAAWYKWPLLTRPMAYLYQTAHNIHDPLPVQGPPLPASAVKIIYDVHAMGNPFLWWFAVAAILFLTIILIFQAIAWFKMRTPPTTETWIAIYIVINYAANLLPWVKVNRCAFIYHYMGAVIFGFLGVAWLVDLSLRSYRRKLRILGVTTTFIIIAAFIFWLPIYLALPLSPQDYRLRMWFNSWI
jgi:dolichyl-phosphate-mannose-protein mannosyltransferase